MLKPAHTFLLLLLGLLPWISACSPELPTWRNSKLIAIVPPPESGASAEFEREMVMLFGRQLNSSVELISAEPDKADRALRRHHAHLAAMALRSEINVNSLIFGPSYQTVHENIVCNDTEAANLTPETLGPSTLIVAAGSAQEAALRETQPAQPELRWTARNNTTTRALLDEVAEERLPCTVANEMQLANARNFHGNLTALSEIGDPSNLAWAFSQDSDPELVREVSHFFDRIKEDGTLRRLLDRFYGHSGRLKQFDAAAFITRAQQTLPDFRAQFEEAAHETGIDWRLLAALAYQESQWDPLATSFTNVRGMMMLTEDTADRMGVNNRLDAAESILAGARYLQLLKDTLPARIAEPDRTWMGLAAYNQGYGHLEDARVLTIRHGGNADSWADVKRWMPLLNRPGHYESLKYGYARGGEAVILVENIRNFYDMLKRIEPDALPETRYSVLPTTFWEPLNALLH